MKRSTSKRSRIHWIVLAVMAGGIVLRFLYLDADPHYAGWIGYITDEGRWVGNARSAALHGTAFADGFDLHFFLAPLFQLAHYAVFMLLDVSVLTSRLLTALAGSALLVVFWLGMRRVVTPEALLLGMTLLAFQSDLVALSRMAVPEMAVMFFQLLIYVLLVAKKASPGRMFLAGVLLWIGMGVKATMAPFLLIFSLVLFLMPRDPMADLKSERWRDLLWFWAGFGVPALIAAVTWSFCCLPERGSMLAYLSILESRLTLSDLYPAVSFPFEHSLAQTFNSWALGFWITMLVWVANRDAIDLQARRYMATAGIWFSLYLSLMLLLGYFPSRYKVHILIPMAVGITAGMSLLQQFGLRTVLDFFIKGRTRAGIPQLAVFVLPTAVFLSPLVASAVGLAGLDVGRLRVKVACLVIALVVTLFLARRTEKNEHQAVLFLCFPLVAGGVWLLGQTFGRGGHAFWPAGNAAGHAALWSVFVLTALVLSAVLVKAAGHGTGWIDAGLAPAAAAIYLTFSVTGLAPAYLDPQYSIRTTSRDLGRVLSDASTVVTSRAEGLFNGNTLPYRVLDGRTWRTGQAEALVLAFSFDDEEGLKRRYRMVKTYRLHVAPEYYRLHGEDDRLASRGEVIRVYKRRSAGDRAGADGGWQSAKAGPGALPRGRGGW